MRKNRSSSEDDLLYVGFIKQDVPLFELDFQVKGMKYDSILLAGFISALTSFAKDLTDKNLELIDQGDIKIGLKEGAYVRLVYITGSVSEELDARLQLVLNNFELRYNEILVDDAMFIDLSILDDFKEYAVHVLSEEAVKPHYVPKVLEHKITSVNPNLLDDWEIIALINGKKTVAEIANQSSKNIASTISILAIFRFQGFIEFQILVKESDILILTFKGMNNLLRPSDKQDSSVSLFGERSLSFIKALDGKTPVSLLAIKFSVELSELQQLLSPLVMKKYTVLVSEVIKTVSIIEYLFNTLLIHLKQELGQEKAYQIITKSLCKESSIISQLPRYTNDKLSFEWVRVFVKEMGFIPYEIYDAFTYPLLSIFSHIEDSHGSEFLNQMVEAVFSEVNSLFGASRITDIK